MKAGEPEHLCEYRDELATVLGKLLRLQKRYAALLEENALLTVENQRLNERIADLAKGP